MCKFKPGTVFEYLGGVGIIVRADFPIDTTKDSKWYLGYHVFWLNSKVGTAGAIDRRNKMIEERGRIWHGVQPQKR